MNMNVVTVNFNSTYDDDCEEDNDDGGEKEDESANAQKNKKKDKFCKTAIEVEPPAAILETVDRITFPYDDEIG